MGVDDGFEDANQEVFDGVEYVDRENENFLCIVQRVLLTPKEPIISQRHSIFSTINKQVCEVFIDRGSNDNIISKQFVKSLGYKLRDIIYHIEWDGSRGGLNIE